MVGGGVREREIESWLAFDSEFLFLSFKQSERKNEAGTTINSVLLYTF